MVWDIWMFILIVLAVFAIVMLIAGAFAAIFGSGKSKAYGIVIVLVGFIVGIAMLYLTVADISPFDFDAYELMKDAIIYLLGILIGALVAVGVFLAAILKA